MGILNVLTLMCLIPVTSKNYFNSVLTGEEQVPWCKRHLKHLYTKKKSDCQTADNWQFAILCSISPECQPYSGYSNLLSNCKFLHLLKIQSVNIKQNPLKPEVTRCFTNNFIFAFNSHERSKIIKHIENHQALKTSADASIVDQFFLDEQQHRIRSFPPPFPNKNEYANTLTKVFWYRSWNLTFIGLVSICFYYH